MKDRNRIKQPKLNLVTVGRDSSFPSPPGAGKGMPWMSHSQQQCLSQKLYYNKENTREGETKNNKLFSVKAKETRCRKQEKKRKKDLGTPGW